ncbi:MAG: rhomboid family intramembrane serine protease [Chthoniobacterales bacterium]|jgi:membrane associated rhomboid family serine protease
MRLSGRKASRFTRSWAPPQRIVLLSLIGLNAAAFIVQLVLTSWNQPFVLEYLGLSDRGINDAYAWQFFTAPLLHNNIWHFAANMLVLYFIGRDVEAIIGQRQFLFLYLFGAFSGELGHLFLMPSDCVLFGASGGVAAIFIAYTTILPELEMTTLLLFMVPVRLKMRRLAQIALVGAVALLLYDRSGAVGHSAFVGGAIAGWFYAHLLGFGRTSLLQRVLRQRRLEAARLQSMRADQFVAEEIDPLLEKISQRGLASLSRRERRLLEQAREKMLSGNAP